MEAWDFAQYLTVLYEYSAIVFFPIQSVSGWLLNSLDYL